MTDRVKSLAYLLEGHVSVPPDYDCGIAGLAEDSRKIKPGDLFFALPGGQFDGRDVIEVAAQKGAAAIVFEPYDDGRMPHVNIPCYPIKDCQSHVSAIAARFFDNPSKSMTVVGVTGTNGKTSVTQFIAQALSAFNKVCGVMGTLGVGFPDQLVDTRFTTPSALETQRLLAELKQGGAECLAMEVSSHALVQHRVADVEFDIGVFTQLSRDHLDYHKNMDAYAKAKQRLFEQPGLRHGVINLDDECGRKFMNRFAKYLNVLTYSLEEKGANVYAYDLEPLPQGYAFSVKTPWGEGRIESVLMGRFNVSNLLSVLTVLGLLECPFEASLNVLSALQTVPGRMQVMGAAPSVVVDYSHTPDALEKALEALREHCKGKLTCVFGCGGDRDPGKRAQMAAIAERMSDVVIVTNDNPRHESPEVIVQNICEGFQRAGDALIILDRAEAIAHAVQSAADNDMVLVAGKGHETYQILGDERLSFSDAEQVIAQLKLRE